MDPAEPFNPYQAPAAPDRRDPIHLPADRERRSRQWWRRASLVFLVALGGILIRMGFQGWELNSIPAQYCGYVLLGTVVLGLLKINIWHGGPLDLRLDPPDQSPTP